MHVRQERPPSPRRADPFSKAWVDTALRALAEHAGQRGAGRDSTGQESTDRLFEILWPWALRTARAQAARLPLGADQDAVCGETLWEVFQAVRRIDWQRYDVWPALLKARLRNAWSSTARADDLLTRGERRARTAYLTQVEAEIQRLGRSLTVAERADIARWLRPHGGTSSILLGRSLLSLTVAPDPGAVGEVADDPAVLLQRRWLCEAVRAWITHDLPPELAHEVSILLEKDEGDRMSSGLLRRIRPYSAALQQRTGEFR